MIITGTKSVLNPNECYKIRPIATFFINYSLVGLNALGH